MFNTGLGGYLERISKHKTALPLAKGKIIHFLPIDKFSSRYTILVSATVNFVLGNTFFCVAIVVYQRCVFQEKGILKLFSIFGKLKYIFGV